MRAGGRAGRARLGCGFRAGEFLRSGFRCSEPWAGFQALPALARKLTWFHWLLPRDTRWCLRVGRDVSV